jgi:CysZ protein
MNLFRGIKYNLQGLSLGLKTSKLLLLGIIRFMVVIIITILSASLILVYHQEILNLMWRKPESQWIIVFLSFAPVGATLYYIDKYRT